MYTQSARYYDELYRATGKDYAREAQAVREKIERARGAAGTSLLDVACGTGKHIEALRSSFACEGLDVDRSMLEIARDRNPQTPFHLGDMIGFNLGKRFDAIVCLFSAIGYVPNAGRLDQTLATFARHLAPGGVVLIEPWVAPEAWQDGAINALYVDEPELKVARMAVSRRDGSVCVLNYHYMIASRDGIRTFTEPHRLTLFTDRQYRDAFERAGFTVEFDADFPGGRGLYIGRLN